MEKVRKVIAASFESLLGRLSEAMRDQLLLTGGAAAFLYGSERPFSHDMDFMVPMDRIREIERALEMKFERHTKKAVFHSLKVSFEEGKESYDLIAESIIEPENGEFCCKIHLTEKILQRKTAYSLEGQTLYLIPKELLVLIKLLAGRGQELGKYDLYDAKQMLESAPEFDFDFFVELVRDFCVSSGKILPVLEKNAAKVGHIKLLEALKSLRKSD